jgi:hypothetical protein
MMADPTADSAFPLPPSALADLLDVFFGAASPAEARIYARLELSEENARAGYQLAGRVVGPECAFSHTLPARMPMMDRGEGNRLLLETVVPDPCFWTPELPFLYRVQIELQRGGETIEKCERLVGIRRFGVRNRALNFDGKRFVLRGVHSQSEISNFKSQIQNDAAFLRETWTALVVYQPDAELCEFASRNGLLLVAELSGASSIASKIALLAKWPAVVMAVVNGDARLPAEISEIARNLVLAQAVAAGEPMQLADWAQVAVVEIRELEKLAAKIAGCNLPIFAYRPELRPAEIEKSRAACDRLQRDLASLGDFAGYMV